MLRKVGFHICCTPFWKFNCDIMKNLTSDKIKITSYCIYKQVEYLIVALRYPRNSRKYFVKYNVISLDMTQYK